jgi:hypothetical protein
MRRRIFQRPGRAAILAGMVLAASLCTAEPISPQTTELPSGWRMASAWDVVEEGSAISQLSYDASKWHKIARMPATVFEVSSTTISSRAVRTLEPSKA